jgi:sarcosine oxidase subunit alpha
VHDQVPAYLYGQQLANEVLAQENIRVLISTFATSIYQSNHVTAVQRGGPSDYFRLRYYEIRAKSVVIATGGIERPLIFQNNDCPGVMQGSCVQQLAHTYGLKPGEQAVFSGFHDGLLEVAVDLAEVGVSVVAVADARKKGFDTKKVERLNRLGIPFFPGYLATKAKQLRTIKGVTLESMDSSKKRKFDCDLLVASAGEVPLSVLLHVAGTPMIYDSLTARYLPKELPPGIQAAGRVLALDNTETIEVQGKLAGLKALQDVGLDVSAELEAARDALASLPGSKPGLNGVYSLDRAHKSFVSFDEDVTVNQVGQAIDEGFDQPELVKRYTSAGTGPSQSYLSGYNLPMLVAAKRGLSFGDVLPSTVRPPLLPTSLAVLAGRRYNPVKHTPLRLKQEALGATVRLVGEWSRARYFTDEQAFDEIVNVRTNVGFIDISTLGKFRVHGPDALKLLQRVYVNDVGKAKEGKLTYSVMCNEEGVVIDDGVITKQHENDYFITTSTLRASNTSEWLKFHIKEEDWKAYVVNLTDALAAINLAGPRAREVLTKLTDHDVSNEAFPFMGFRRMIICGDIEAMVARLGFVGEICYEIHVPSSYGPALHDAILEAGRPFDIKPFGLEAQSVLRLEKGHVIIVVDTDKYTTLHELGLTKIWAQHKTDAKTVGAPALRFAEDQTHRERLVGFIMEDFHDTPPDGSIVVYKGEVKGRICSSRYSPILKQSIGMALVEPDLAVMGGSLEICTGGKLVNKQSPEIKTSKAKIVPMPFFDPEGKRVRG